MAKFLSKLESKLDQHNHHTECRVGKHTVTVKQRLAEGAYGLVDLVVDTMSQQEFVLKRCSIQRQETYDIVNKEIKMLSMFSSPYVIEYHGSEIINQGRGQEALILLSYCSGGNLFQNLSARGQANYIPLNNCLSIFQQILLGVQKFHEHTPPVTHRDLKLENILFAADNSIRLCDFGSCCIGYTYLRNQAERSAAEEVIQKETTPMYRAPEMIDLYLREELTEKTDIWALGCIFSTICFLRHPFQDVGSLGILNGKILPFPADSPMPPFIKDFIMRMLDPDPEARPSIREMLPWVSAMSKGKSLPPYEISDEAKARREARMQANIAREQKIHKSKPKPLVPERKVTAATAGVSSDSVAAKRLAAKRGISPVPRHQPQATITPTPPQQQQPLFDVDFDHLNLNDSSNDQTHLKSSAVKPTPVVSSKTSGSASLFGFDSDPFADDNYFNSASIKAAAAVAASSTAGVALAAPHPPSRQSSFQQQQRLPPATPKPPQSTTAAVNVSIDSLLDFDDDAGVTVTVVTSPPTTPYRSTLNLFDDNDENDDSGVNNSVNSYHPDISSSFRDIAGQNYTDPFNNPSVTDFSFSPPSQRSQESQSRRSRASSTHSSKVNAHNSNSSTTPVAGRAAVAVGAVSNSPYSQQQQKIIQKKFSFRESADQSFTDPFAVSASNVSFSPVSPKQSPIDIDIDMTTDPFHSIPSLGSGRHSKSAKNVGSKQQQLPPQSPLSKSAHSSTHTQSLANRHSVNSSSSSSSNQIAASTSSKSKTQSSGSPSSPQQQQQQQAECDLIDFGSSSGSSIGPVVLDLLSQDLYPISNRFSTGNSSSHSSNSSSVHDPFGSKGSADKDKHAIHTENVLRIFEKAASCSAATFPKERPPPLRSSSSSEMITPRLSSSGSSNGIAQQSS